LSTEYRHHVGGIDAISGARLDGVDGGAVGDLCGLEAEVDDEGLDDGSGDRVVAGVCADDDADETVCEAEDDAELRHEAIDHGFGVEGPEDHGADPDEREQSDGQRAVGVGWRGEEEGEGGPVAGEDGGGAEADEAGLDENRVFDHHFEDAEEDAEVVYPLGVGAGVVGHEEVEEKQDEILHAE